MFDAIVFAVAECGFRPRCALEADDGGEVRVDKIGRIIRECGFGVHDLSFMGIDKDTGLARLNMAFELGLFLGARRFGVGRVRDKVTLILDRDKFRYQKSISDIAGQDIRSHNNEPERAIEEIRDWLQTSSQEDDIPGGASIVARYTKFSYELPDLCATLRLSRDKLTFVDLSKVIARWLKQNA